MAGGSASDGGARWVSASRLRSFVLDDPILDWLHTFGEAKGYAPDPSDERTDFGAFIMRRGSEFEAGVLRVLGERGFVLETVQGEGPKPYRAEAVAATVDAMRRGVEVIVQGLVADEATRTYGSPDLLVRSDVLNRLMPGTVPQEALELGVKFRDPRLTPAEAATRAPALGLASAHYVVVDIKYTSLHFSSTGTLGPAYNAYAAQTAIYSRALAGMQGYAPPRAFLLGRSWDFTVTRLGIPHPFRSDSCLDLLGPVDVTSVELWELVERAVAWLRRVRACGAEWVAEPVPSAAELRPNMTMLDDAPWHGAKKAIAERIGELTALWQVGVRVRNAAVERGITDWRDPRCTAESLGIGGGLKGPRLQAVLDANRTTDGPDVTPAAIDWGGDWRAPKRCEFYVDFETVSDLDDDFTTLPLRSGSPLIFQIGCLSVVDGREEFWQETVDRLTEAEEARIVEAWVGHMRLLCGDEPPRVFHWSQAEVSFLEAAYNAYLKRNPAAQRAEIEWFDFLSRVIKPPVSETGGEPRTVAFNGAFGFGLKAVAKSLRSHGRIATIWGDGPADGLGAMVGAWWCEAQARARGGTLMDQRLTADESETLMQQIAAYNQVDCRTMREIIGFLRERG